jgi:hypothetical protein
MDEQSEQNQQPEPAQPSEAPPQPPQAAPQRNTDAFILWGFISAAVGFFGFCCCCCPSIFGIVAIVLGAIAYSRGDQRGMWVIIAGAVALLAGSGISIGAGPMIHRWAPQLPYDIPGPWRRI